MFDLPGPCPESPSSSKTKSRFASIVMGYETSKLITSDTDLERGNAQRERWKIATTCWSPRVYVIQRTNRCGSAQTKRSRPRPKRRLFIE